ncbi:MAG TPA: permease [Candidatus Hydrogenedentes bacterium]|nr:permease [Candidatus Hydrogenedentota bacterium]
MSWREEWKYLVILLTGFLVCFFLPVGLPRFDYAVNESMQLVRWYAREHVVLCLLPAFFIAGAISVFVSQDSVMKYLGAGANKFLAYGVASVSGTILAVCSCTVLPLFGGIWRMGAGLGPAIAFLYSGPAINVLAIIMTARILGFRIGVARAVGAVLFSIVIGLLMHFFFRKDEEKRVQAQAATPDKDSGRPLWQTASYFAAMVAVLVFANWGKADGVTGTWAMIYRMKWVLTSISGGFLGVILGLWYGMAWWKLGVTTGITIISALVFPHEPLVPFAAAIVCLGAFTSTAEGELKEWFAASWALAKQIMPLLLFGVAAAGFFLGRPGAEGIIPNTWVSAAVGGNSIWANLLAAVIGAFMYFATLTEVPILQGLIGSGMGQGPALALLLAGPALSLPSMLVIASIMGTKKTSVYCALVVVMATITGALFGMLPATL